jgi:hypothetical protein
VSLTSCWQCDLDIPHSCYAGMPNARWGMTDEAVAALEAAQRHGFMLSAEQHREQQRRRATSKRRRAR